MATLIDAVNRVLRINTIIADDDDDITTFSDTQHKGTLTLAKIAVQSTITELTSDRLLPYEETDGTITLVTDQRVYALPSDFVRFVDENPFLLFVDGSDVSENQWVALYPGGEASLKREVLDYRSQSGTPRYFYMVNSTTKQIGMYQVPGSDDNGQALRITYEKSIYPTSETDTLPFHTTQESEMFMEMAGRRFQFMFTGQVLEGLEQDTVYKSAKANLMNLARQTYGDTSYGYNYS